MCLAGQRTDPNPRWCRELNHKGVYFGALEELRARWRVIGNWAWSTVILDIEPQVTFSLLLHWVQFVPSTGQLASETRCITILEG